MNFKMKRPEQLAPIETGRNTRSTNSSNGNASAEFLRTDVVYSTNGGSPLASPSGPPSSGPSPRNGSSPSLVPSSASPSDLHKQVFDFRNISEAKRSLDEAMEVLQGLTVSGKNSASSSGGTVSASPHSGAPSSSGASRLASADAPAVNRWNSLIGPVDWSGIVQALKSPARTHFEAELYSRLLSRKLPVNQYLPPVSPASSYIVSKDAVRSCSACECTDETIEHAFANCPVARKFWILVWEKILSRLYVCVDGNGNDTPGRIQAQELLTPEKILGQIVYFFPDVRRQGLVAPEHLHILNVVHSVGLWGVWGSRQMSRRSAETVYSYFEARLLARLTIEFQDDESLFLKRWARFVSVAEGRITLNTATEE
ncbi:MAG: hypothetical protein SGCHY_000323 [Lobulomycetales sp.]